MSTYAAVATQYNAGNGNSGAELRDKLMRLNWLQHRRFAQDIADLDLTVPQFYTLSTLVGLGGTATMGQLARMTHQVSATMTGIVDRLVRDGLVERNRGEQDRRSVVVSITAAGRELVDRAWNRAQYSLEIALEGMDPEEQAAAYRFVDSLVTAMEKGGKESDD